jgi:histidine ammonia-lyase
MVISSRRRWRGVRAFAIAGGLLLACSSALAAPDSVPPYNRISPVLQDRTIVLTGRDLTADQVVQVARFGAHVALSPEARQRSADAYGLLLEAAAEGVPVYWFNRGAGAGREAVMFEGDPLSAENKSKLERRQLVIFEQGAWSGFGPEVSEEEIVRAMLVVRANTMTYEAASPALTQALLDLINHRITPVVQSRGSVGEGDLGPLSNVGATLVGAGDAYYRGVRMAAKEALKRSGLTPLQPFAADDSELTSSNAYASGPAALLVADARRALDWADLVYSIELNGMNSSITPLSYAVQSNRPYKWLNWDASRVLSSLKGSYLFDDDAKRIIQDPESLRASSVRQGSAWQAWGALRDDVLVQINSSDHNPAVRVGLSPQDSWDLNTPQLLKYFVKGGPHSNGKHGFIVSNANWDPYPLANDIEAFTIALANLDGAAAQRVNRFTSTFFTVIRPDQVLPQEQTHGGIQGNGFASSVLIQEIQGLAVPVSPEGTALIQTVEDMQAQTRLKVERARRAVEDTVELLAENFLTGTYWLDVRRAQDPTRNFGVAPTAAWTAFRKILPFSLDAASRPARPIHDVAAQFLKETAAATFLADDPPIPGELESNPKNK